MFSETGRLPRFANNQMNSWRFNMAFQSATLPFLKKKLETFFVSEGFLSQHSLTTSFHLWFSYFSCTVIDRWIGATLKSWAMSNARLSISTEGDGTIIAVFKRDASCLYLKSLHILWKPKILLSQQAVVLNFLAKRVREREENSRHEPLAALSIEFETYKLRRNDF